MDQVKEAVIKIYGNRLRTRVCGLCMINDKILMINHRGVGQTDTFWCPPGGEVQFGETVPSALIREFREETGLDVAVGRMLFVNEFMRLPLHAVELFFEVSVVGGQMVVGSDPEMNDNEQVIQALKLMTFDEIKQHPIHEVHALFGHCSSRSDVFSLSGYLTSN